MGLHIGELIKLILGQSGMSATKFANLLEMDRGNVYDIFKRQSIDTELLHVALGDGFGC